MVKDRISSRDYVFSVKVQSGLAMWRCLVLLEIALGLASG